MAVERKHSWVTSNVVARVLIAFSLAIGAMIAADPITNLIGVRDLYGLVFAACLLPLCWFYDRCFPSRTDQFGFVCAYFSAALVLNCSICSTSLPDASACSGRGIRPQP
jgi:hypothetical protein